MTAIKTPKISVITAVLNGASSLEQALHSVFEQSYPKIESIVIDGGSTDGTLDIIQRYSKDITYWETGLDTGIADAFNRGISKASGELIAILNSDDKWLPDVAEKVAESYTEDPHADVFYGHIEFKDHKSGDIHTVYSDVSQIKKRMSVFHPCLFIKREAYEMVGGYSKDYSLAMDCDWVHRAMSYGLRFRKIDCVLAQMSLGGFSDRHYLQALYEYRRSVVKNLQVSWLQATYYFFVYALFKTVCRFRFFRSLRNLVKRQAL